MQTWCLLPEPLKSRCSCRNPAAAPSAVGAFHGPCDALHAALGFAAGFLPPAWRTASLACFLAYQMARTKPAQSKVAALTQYGIGALGRGLF